MSSSQKRTKSIQKFVDKNYIFGVFLKQLEMNDNIDLLKVRIDLIESRFFGRKIPIDDSTIQHRLQVLDSKLLALEKEVPAVKACTDSILKLSPFITDKKLQISQINEKIESLMLRKDELQLFIKDLEAIKTLSPVLDAKFCSNIDIDECHARLANLNELLIPLFNESQQQSKELDALLEAYEKAMIFISDVCQSWDEQVRQLEREH